MRPQRVRWFRWLIYSALLALYISSAMKAHTVEVTKDDVDFRKIVYLSKEGARLPYRLYVPHSYSNQQKYPLVLWLHGGTGRGSDNLKQLDKQNQLGTHFWIAPDVQERFPAFVLVPQCPSGEVWAEPEFNQPGKALLLTVEVLAKVQKDYSIDPDRIYVAGQSMGGSGVWSLLQNYPEKWAGALVLSAYDTFTDPEAIAQIPLWVFQGDEDMSVPVDMVRTMMKQLKKLHANSRYTEYHKMDHEVWTKAFAEPDLLPWLSSQKRRQAAQSQLGSGAATPSH
jgi:predicted peptidase